ncbi:hypothetical protein JXA56_01625 [Candidatus Micrarchaeota archaeon]|nr:hypothetical protein [Candidatus Micrarchaeota archaeon]
MKPLFALMILTILIFGCTQQEVPSETSEAPASETTGQDDVPAQEPAQEPSQVPQEPVQESKDDLIGKNFVGLAALGVPLECDITVALDGQMTKTKLYMQGESQIRSEMDIEEQSGCTKFIYIFKNKKAYMGCEDGNIFGDAEMFEGCNWIEFSTEESDSSGYSASTPDFQSVPSTNINCVPWLYDSSKFDTPGKVCNMEQIMQEMQNAYR